MLEIKEVTSHDGTVYEVKLLAPEGVEIEYREKGTTEWADATWGCFCKSKGIDLDALA